MDTGACGNTELGSTSCVRIGGRNNGKQAGPQNTPGPDLEARLVVQGYQGTDLATITVPFTASATSRDSHFSIASAAALKGRTLFQLYITVAILEGDGFDRDVFAKAPTIEKKPSFWELTGAAYSLNDAPRFFSQRPSSLRFGEIPMNLRRPRVNPM